jgi:hypothetical protein
MDTIDAFDALFPGHATYFLSGSNHAGEIRGLALSGRHIGVSAAEVGPAAEEELLLLAGGPTRIFVDSGAFGEIAFGPTGPRVKKLITDAQWRKRLGLYRRLAEQLRGQLFCVAPDMVGFQEETLARLSLYRAELLQLRALGANLIVPVQKGALSMPAFAERAAEILGTADVIWGIPSKKDATSLEDMASFAAFLHAKGQPTRVHLLGLGPESKRFAAAFSAIVTASPWTTIFSDSVRITAMSGNARMKKDGTPGKARIITATRAKLIAEAAALGRTLSAYETKSASLIQIFHARNITDAQAARRAGWFDPELESAPGVPLEEGCIEYGPGGPFGDGRLI